MHLKSLLVSVVGFPTKISLGKILNYSYRWANIYNKGFVKWYGCLLVIRNGRQIILLISRDMLAFSCSLLIVQ